MSPRMVLLPLALASSCAGPRASGGMPAEFFWADQYNGGNCGYMAGVDADGVLGSSEGCESSAHNNPPRKLDAAQRAAFVAALDRLRASTLWAADASAGRCGNGLNFRIVERSGARREFSFCSEEGTAPPDPDAAPRAPRELLDVLDVLRPPVAGAR